jgi:hypothetical protein
MSYKASDRKRNKQEIFFFTKPAQRLKLQHYADTKRRYIGVGFFDMNNTKYRMKKGAWKFHDAEILTFIVRRL